MNRSELASDLSLTRDEPDRIAAAVFATIGDAIATDESVAMAGFGTFSTRTPGARRRRKPRTGEAIDIAASRAPAFKASKTSRDALNKPQA